MKVTTDIIGISSFFATIALALYLSSWWSLLCLPLLAASIFTAVIGNHAVYWSNTKKAEEKFKELEAEKEAYASAKESYEQVGLLLGDILVEKKENY